MSIKLEEMMDEFRYPSSINTAKSITTTGDVAGANITGSATGAFAAGTFSGAVAVAGALNVTGATTLQTPFGVGNAGIKVGSLSGNLNPTGTTGGIGTLFINSSAGATGVTNRIYINTDGATAWTYLTTGA